MACRTKGKQTNARPFVTKAAAAAERRLPLPPTSPPLCALPLKTLFPLNICTNSLPPSSAASANRCNCHCDRASSILHRELVA